MKVETGYSVSDTVKIIRRKHTICFRIGSCSAYSLSEMIQKVPPGATVDEVVEHDDCFLTIEFHEERTG